MAFRKKVSSNVVASYKLSIVGLFFVLTLIAFFLVVYGYFEETRSLEKQTLRELVRQSKLLNEPLNKAVNSLSSLEKFANYTIQVDENSTRNLPSFAQEGEQFYLNKNRPDITQQRQFLSVNITGKGNINTFSDLLKRELIMANSLTPAYVTAKADNEASNWFYYISKNNFVSIFPWVHRNNWRFSEELFEQNHYQKISLLPKKNDQYIWSSPFIGAGGSSLYSAVGTGVYHNNSFLGALIVTIDLAKLYPQLALSDGQIALIDNHDNLLIHHTKDQKPLKRVSKWKEVLPKELSDLAVHVLGQSETSFRYKSWLIQKVTLPSNGWTLIKYQRYVNFSTPLYQKYVLIFILSAIVLFLLLFAVYTVTHKTFVKPTRQFINHIAYSAKGDHSKVLPPTGWQHWFDVVSDIFSQNRSLLQQLKDQNSILDVRVNEKTTALLEKNIQHQRDYAILRSVMNAIPDYLIFSDKNGLLIGCNAAFEELVHRKEQDILETKAYQLFPAPIVTAITKNFNESLNTPLSDCQTFETIERSFELFISRFFDNENNVLGSLVVLRDITEQSLINIALSDAKEEAEQASKAKSQFLANMSHEIRTPINAIQGMYSLLEKTSLSNQQRLHLSNAQTASYSLLYLVDELLDLAKIESGNLNIIKANYSLDNIIKQALNLNINEAKNKQLKVDVNIEFDVPLQVYTDEMRLIQVLSNLMNNAIKFTHKGHVGINVQTITQSNIDTLVKFTIKDTGIGIEKSNQAHLFNAFMQADESMTRLYGGSGLGLSICQRIVNLLEGEIKLKSEIGQGSEFSFVIPMRVVEADSFFEKAHGTKIISVNTVAPKAFETLVTNLCFDFSVCKIEKGSSGENNYTALINELVESAQSASSTIILLSLSEIEKALCVALSKVPERCSFSLMIEMSGETEVSHEKFQLLTQFKLAYTIFESPLYRDDLLTHLKALKSGTLNENLSDTLTGEYSLTTNPEEKENSLHANLSGIRILLVEDNLVNQLVAKEILIGIGASVEIVDNGEKAIKKVVEESYDVVLMDIQMPVMDGLTASRVIRNDLKLDGLPIIAMTAHAREEDKTNCIEAGMNMHLSKPVKVDTLRTAILSLVKPAT